MDLKRTLVPLALTASLGLAACGSSSGGSSALSRKDITAKANTICNKAEAASKKLKEPSDITDPKQAAAYFDKADPLAQQETDDLAALKPDDEVKADWNAFLAKQREGAALLQTIRKKADAKDASGLDDLKKLANIDVTTTAKKVGATDCG